METEAKPADERFVTALVEEATKKSGLLWISVPDGERDTPGRPAWHVWLDGAVYVLSGGGEQPIPGLAEARERGGEVTLTVRSRDKGGRLLRYQARARPIEPGTPAWDTAVVALHGKRLNAPDGERAPARWARESLVTRLEPTGQILQAPGAQPDGDHAAPPRPTSATTRGPLPAMIGRRRAGRRRPDAPG